MPPEAPTGDVPDECATIDGLGTVEGTAVDEWLGTVDGPEAGGSR